MTIAQDVKQVLTNQAQIISAVQALASAPAGSDNSAILAQLSAIETNQSSELNDLGDTSANPAATPAPTPAPTATPTPLS